MTDQHDTDTDSDFDIFDAFVLEPDELTDGFGGDIEPGDDEAHWLMQAFDAIAHEAITDRGMHPVAVASAVGAYHAAFNGRVTAARNLDGDDSPFSSLEQEFDKQRYLGLPYYQFKRAMDDADLGGGAGMGAMVMTPDDLPDGVRAEVMQRIQSQIGNTRREGMFQ